MQKDCFWCQWHNWDTDRCIKDNSIVTHDDACEQYEKHKSVTVDFKENNNVSGN